MFYKKTVFFPLFFFVFFLFEKMIPATFSVLEDAPATCSVLGLFSPNYFMWLATLPGIYLLATLPETGDGRLGSDFSIGPFVSELFQVISHFTPN